MRLKHSQSKIRLCLLTQIFSFFLFVRSGFKRPTLRLWQEVSGGNQSYSFYVNGGSIWAFEISNVWRSKCNLSISCLKYSVLPYVLMSLNQLQFKNSRFEDTKITDEIRTKVGLEGGGVLSYFFLDLFYVIPLRVKGGWKIERLCNNLTSCYLLFCMSQSGVKKAGGNCHWIL